MYPLCNTSRLTAAYGLIMQAQALLNDPALLRRSLAAVSTTAQDSTSPSISASAAAFLPAPQGSSEAGNAGFASYK